MLIINYANNVAYEPGLNNDKLAPNLETDSKLLKGGLWIDGP